ncbi:hypothetical protein BFJ69_g4140 [Fusarium oxysporum]|uniref:Uncharacterized protein n=1 Tax=Fusarium oxysporum TaxID=5507 RepID=A0A420NK51_FUSOX|nr:hypothetical protein BFJ69_g4140 [Fusarium oxysporum]
MPLVTTSPTSGISPKSVLVALKRRGGDLGSSFRCCWPVSCIVIIYLCPSNVDLVMWSLPDHKKKDIPNCGSTA